MRPEADRRVAFAAQLAGNLMVGAVFAWAWGVRRFSADLYYRAVQEDEALEWATFWAFAVAATIAFVAAARQRRVQGGLPWFLAGVGLFCIFVAGEEISWAQRVFAYRPPTYFLAHNYQQELNLHNVVDSGLRKLALKGIILGYGVVLPLVAAVGPLRRVFDRARIVAPPLALAPAFVATFWLYQSYPWTFSGEVVELMLGLAFLFALLAAADRFAGDRAARRRWLRGVPGVAIGFALAVGLGFATAAASRLAWKGHPGRIESARVETGALRADFLGGKARLRCGLHKRVFTFLEKYDQDGLFEGRFAALRDQGLPEERAAFFLDPWNSPYWIRHKCDRDRGLERAFVYSFGPNRRRDSTDWALGGDDIGALIVSRGSPPDCARGRPERSGRVRHQSDQPIWRR